MSSEFSSSFEKILRRKIREELGPSVKYSVQSPSIFMRHERKEADSGRKSSIFAIGYPATFLRGIIQLSGQHTEFRWVPINFKPKSLFRGGWLEGVKEYQKSSI